LNLEPAIHNHIQDNFLRFFESSYRQFNQSGQPVISAIITTDGKTTQPYDTFSLLSTIYTIGGAECPEKMLVYMEKLAAESHLPTRPGYVPAYKPEGLVF